MLPWVERPTLTIDLDAPEERRFRDVPAEVFASGRTLLAAVKAEMPPAARPLADWVRLRTANRFHAEVTALARQVGADWRDVLLANVSYDLLMMSLGCSTIALATPRGPVLARNMDWWPEQLLARASYLIRCSRGSHLRFVSAGWPGAVGVVSGMSARGFAVVLNAVSCPEASRKTGYPVLLHLRRVVEDAADFAEAVSLLSEQTLAAPALFTLVGRRNDERVVIERTPSRCALRRPHGDEPLFTTNDYRLLDRPQSSDINDLTRTTCARYDALCRFFAELRPAQDVDDAALLYILSDPSVIQGITCQHTIFRPATGEARLFVPRRLLEGDGTRSTIPSS